MPSTKESVDRGKELFQQNCIQCHGLDGRGDRPQAPSLSPAPTGFRLHMPLHTDQQFYAFTANRSERRPSLCGGQMVWVFTRVLWGEPGANA